MDELKNIIPGVINHLSLKMPDQQEKIYRLWQNILNKKELEHTRISGIKSGVITIFVDSPAWLYQMNLRRKTILERFSQEDTDIKKISFKIGKVK